MARTLAPDWKQIDQGVIIEGGYSQDSGYDFRTEQGWFHIEYNEDPDNWDKDWNNLTFDERIALCEKYDVIYMATRVITIDEERKI